MLKVGLLIKFRIHSMPKVRFQGIRVFAYVHAHVAGNGTQPTICALECMDKHMQWLFLA